MALGLLTHHFGNKEKLFLTAGLDVLHELIRTIQTTVQDTPNGLEAVRAFCTSYFDFARDPGKDFMVLIRCSPFSDLKAISDKELMVSTFSKLYYILIACVTRGIKDGSIRRMDPKKTAVVVFCTLVGGIRHGFLTAYGDDSMFDDIVAFLVGGLKPTPGS